MNGDIDGEDEEYVKIYVTDNTETEHDLTVDKESGEIAYHTQDGYPDDPTERTLAESERVHQARKFAQYCVFTERGYDTVPPTIHPERLNAVRVSIATLTEDRLDDYFGDFYRQLRSHHHDTDRVIDVPADATDADSVLYRKNVYLGLDPGETELREGAQELAARHGFDFSDRSISERSLDTVSGEELDSWTAFSQDLGELAVETDADLSEGLQIDSVSSLYTAYLDDRGEEHVTDADEPFEREPDALLELPMMDPGSLEAFRDYLNHNLSCQIRDCFVRMGLEPPEPFRILGYGRFEAAEQYRHLEMYPNYIDPEEERAFAYG